MIKRVSILGLGLMGGSLGFAIKARGHADQVIGYDLTKEICLKAVERRCVDVATSNLMDAVEDADLVLVCTPIDMVVPLVRQVVPLVKKNAIITDVASTKLMIVSHLGQLSRKDVYFIGGHPMAGSDQSGIMAARPDLFHGALYLLTPTFDTNRDALEELDEFIQKLTPRVEHISPETHDQLVALSSHLPYMLASVLVRTFMSSEDPPLKQVQDVASSGFRDTSRVAASPAEWGRNVSVSNQGPILKQLDRFLAEAKKLRDAVAKGDQAELQKFFETVSDFRRKMVSSEH